MSCVNDSWLKARMQEVGIFTWKELRQRTGFSFLSLQLIRKNEASRLELRKLNRLAATLNWELEELLDKLNLVKISYSKNNSNNNEDIWRLECERLHSQLERQAQESTSEAQESIFKQLQTLLVNYPSLRQIVRVKPELPAKNFISLFTPLDNLLINMGYTPIGKPWQEVKYSPELHQADSEEIQPNDRVYIRFIGYQKGEKIVCPAKVSRDLPGGIK